MDWVKFGRAKIKEQEIEEVRLLKDHLLKDEKKSFEAISHLSFRQEWKDFLDTLEKKLEKEFDEL